MARNYSCAEAVRIIVEGVDLEACADIGKRYPLLAQKIAKVGTKAGEEFVDLAGFIPEHISANKVNSAIKRVLEESDTEADEDETEEEEAPKATKKAAKEQTKKTGKAGRPKKVDEDIEDDGEESATDYDFMTNAKMYKLLGEMGKRNDCKAKFGDLSHDSMLKYLKKYGNAAPAEAEDEDEDEAEEETADYTGMKAMELYKLCKQRKIKAEAKKPAKYYIDLLKKADAAAAAEEDADDEDWEDDEEEVEETPKKAAKKAPAKKAEKPAKKAAKKSEPEEDEDDEDDDDDEWDI